MTELRLSAVFRIFLKILGEYWDFQQFYSYCLKSYNPFDLFPFKAALANRNICIM